jgi:hypothetical protein
LVPCWSIIQYFDGNIAGLTGPHGASSTTVLLAVASIPRRMSILGPALAIATDNVVKGKVNFF